MALVPHATIITTVPRSVYPELPSMVLCGLAEHVSSDVGKLLAGIALSRKHLLLAASSLHAVSEDFYTAYDFYQNLLGVGDALQVRLAEFVWKTADLFPLTTMQDAVRWMLDVEDSRAVPDVVLKYDRLFSVYRNGIGYQPDWSDVARNKTLWVRRWKSNPDMTKTWVQGGVFAELTLASKVPEVLQQGDDRWQQSQIADVIASVAVRNEKVLATFTATQWAKVLCACGDNDVDECALVVAAVASV